MKLKMLFLFILLFFLNISIGFCQSVHSEAFKVTVAGNYFHSSRTLGSCQAIQISNEKGKSLYHYVVTKEDKGKDLLIEFNRKPSSKMLVTCLVIGNSGGIDAYTYVDVENGSYIENYKFSSTWRDPYHYTSKSQKVEIELNDINSLKEFHIPYPSRLRKIKHTIEDNTLNSKYYHSDDLGIYFLVKIKGRDYHYYFDENYNIDDKNRGLNIEEDFEDLPACKVNQRLFFPETSRWRGSVKVWLNDYPKPVYVFSNINLRGVNKNTYWDLNLPHEDIAYTHVEVQPKHGKMVINKIFDGLPTEIKAPKISIHTPNENDLKTILNFNTSKNVGFYTATYYFNVGRFYSEHVDIDFTTISRWQFIGVDQLVDIKIPEIDINLITEVEGLASLKNPNYLSIVCFEAEYEDPKEYWTTPHMLLRRSWQMESGILGVKKWIVLNKK